MIPEVFCELFCVRIREARQLRGLSLGELSSRTNISKGVLSRYETGKMVPSAEKLWRIGEELNISLNALVTTGLKYFDLSDDEAEEYRRQKRIRDSDPRCAEYITSLDDITKIREERAKQSATELTNVRTHKEVLN